jgi:ribosomal protein S18 acetylase RimI-like enzyme
MIKVRKAKISDAKKMNVLYLRCWNETYKNILSDNCLKQKKSDFYSFWKNKPNGYICYIAMNNDDIIGFVDGVIANKSCLWSLYVLAKFHEQGIGRMLFEVFSSETKKANKRAFSFCVLAKNKKAKSFYEYLNCFQAKTEIKRIFGKEKVVIVRYKKFL